MPKCKVIEIQYAFTLYVKFTTNKYYTFNNTLLKKKNTKYINLSPTTT